MEADRMRNLSFDPKMIESERGVVASERQTSVENSNRGTLSEQLTATAYVAHPYAWPVIGWASDIKAWTLDDLKSHFRMAYAPNNATVVIVGDVETPAVLKLAKEFFEPIPSQEPPPPVRTVEPAQQGERRVMVIRPAELPIQMVSYHVPAWNHADTVPLRVLGAMLATGQSSRLYRRMVDTDQIATSVRHYLAPGIDPGQMVFTIDPRAGIDTSVTENALFEELGRAATAEIPAGELQKAKNLLLTELYRSAKTISDRATLIGGHEVMGGDYRRLFTMPAEIEAVTAADVHRVAKQYLRPQNRTVATLVPEQAQ